MFHSTPTQLCFPPIPGFTLRADFEGGALSSDFGPLLLRGIDQQMGLTHRLAHAFEAKRHPSYLDHSLRDLLAQRIYHVACGYEDGNDANSLRTDPMFKLGLERAPLDPTTDLASAATFSRLENSATRKDIYRLAQTVVDQFIASYATPPAVIVLDLVHTEDETQGQQEFAFYNHYYRSHCYLPLLIFEGLSGHLVTAILRPGKRPTGAEKASLLQRVLRRLRAAWPETRIILRGDSHFANPDLMPVCQADPALDFLFGLAKNPVLLRLAEPTLTTARQHHAVRCQNAVRAHRVPPSSTGVYTELDYTAGSWPQTGRVILKAEVMALGDTPRFVVTSLDLPTPQGLYRDLYCARGQDENYIKMVKNDLHSDRTSEQTFLANHLRLFFACAAYGLLHSLRTQTLAHTDLAHAQPTTLILKLFTLAVRVVQYRDRIKLHLPTACTVRGLLQRVTEILYQVPTPAWNSS